MPSFCSHSYKPLLTSILVLLLRCIQSQAQIEKSLLWEIIPPPKESKKSYLYGTVHLTDSRVFNFGDSLMNCFQQCEVFAGETVVNKRTSGQVGKAMLLPSDQSLKSLIGKSHYKKLKSFLKSNELGAYRLFINRIKPFWVLGIMQIPDVYNSKGEKDVLDLYLQKLAGEKKMKVLGLEDIQSQLAFIDKISLEEQASILKQVIEETPVNKRDKSKVVSEFESILKTYLEQDIEKIEKISNSDTNQAALKAMNIILKDRNDNMANKVMEFTQQNSCFIAVGVAHLAGEKGIINQLRNAGYKLRPIYCPFKTNQ